MQTFNVVITTFSLLYLMIYIFLYLIIYSINYQMFYNWWFTCLTSTIESETLKGNDLVLLIPSIMSQRRQWHPALVFLPGKSHGQRSLVGCSHGVAKSWTRLSDFTFTFRFHALEKAMATHSSVLAWRIPWIEEPGGLPSMGSHRVGHDWSDLAAAVCNHTNTEFSHM